jgi:hypothetical protein
MTVARESLQSRHNVRNARGPGATSKPENTCYSEGLVGDDSVRAKMSASARLLGFDIGDWSILAAGLALAGLLTMLV